MTSDAVVHQPRALAQDRPVSGHLVALPGDWALWRWAALRGAGFPAQLVLRMAAPELARRVDALLDAEEARDVANARMLAVLRGDFASVAQAQLVAIRRARKRAEKGKLPAPEDVQGFADAELDALRAAVERAEAARHEVSALVEEARRSASRALAEMARDARFREAVTWQNRPGVRTALDSLARRDPAAALRTRERQHEDLVANYLHRYCAKNDTIGFFGPVGWARFDASPSAPRIVVSPGPALLASRGVYFEQWGIDAIAEMLSKDARIRPWIPPRRFGFVRLDGAVAHSPVNGKHALTNALLSVLRAADGVTPAREIARALVASAPEDFPDEASVFSALDALCEMQLVDWSLVFGTVWEPDKELRARIERIGDPELRAEALAPLDELEAARRRIVSAAGDADRLGRALDALDETFTRITGQAATRHAGLMYAARGLVVEDCRRDVEVTLGPGILEDLGPALALVLTSARWFTSEVKKAYDAAFRALFDSMVQKTGSPRVPLSDFWFRAQRMIHGAKDRPVDAVAAQLRARWAEILGRPSHPRRVEYASAALRPGVEAAFDVPECGWTAARHHSPDIMLAAPSVEAMLRGEYAAVLGEIHVANNTLDWSFFSSQHPAPDELTDAVMRDMPQHRLVPLQAKHSRTGSARMTRKLLGPNDYVIEPGFEAPPLGVNRVLRAGDACVEASDGALVVRHCEGGATSPLLDVFGIVLGEAITNELDFGSHEDHAPRLAIDRLVIRRESWRVWPSKMTFAYAATDADLFIGARRWARSLGLPRFVFVKSPHEMKPLYVDFESLVSLRIVAKIVRQAKEHVSGERQLSVAEMLPGLDDVWLYDASGQRYTCELRVVAVDRRVRRA